MIATILQKYQKGSARRAPSSPLLFYSNTLQSFVQIGNTRHSILVALCHNLFQYTGSCTIVWIYARLMSAPLVIVGCCTPCIFPTLLDHGRCVSYSYQSKSIHHQRINQSGKCPSQIVPPILYMRSHGILSRIDLLQVADWWPRVR
jgi:hypothetical protein